MFSIDRTVLLVIDVQGRLAELMAGREQVLLCGIETHICVFQTGWDLIQMDRQVQVVADCVSSRTKENKDIGLQRRVQSGAQITSLEMILFELIGAAAGDQFRQIVKLIK